MDHTMCSLMDADLKRALDDINNTTDLLERALKLAGLLTSLFQQRGFQLVVVGGSAVEFYTDGGYMSGDIDFCRTSLKAIPPRLMQDVIADLGGEGVSRSWRICGLYVDMLGFLESETVLPFRELETPYGTVKIIPPELALVERVLVAYHPLSDEALATARKMMAAALGDDDFRWDEARRLAELPSFDVAKEFEILFHEVNHG